jgi:hypothetical protein
MKLGRYTFIVEEDYTRLVILLKNKKTHTLLLDFLIAEKIKTDTLDISVREFKGRPQCYQCIIRYNDKPDLNLARWILDVEDKKVLITFKNHNRLDYREENLIRSERGKIVQNHKGAQKHSKSKIRGVYWNKIKQKWAAEVTFKAKKYFVGYFDNINIAEKEVKLKRSQLHEHSFSDQNIL